MQFNYQRYVLTMLYSPDVSKVFSDDAFLVQAEADKLPANSPLTIVASAQDQALYQVIANRRPNTALQLGSAVPNRPGAYIVAVDQIGPFAVQKPAAPSHLVVNDRKENGLRFRFYQ
jgi:hypothetical protein